MNKKFNQAVIWNYISFACMAVSGLLMNAIIAMYYDAKILGIFSETYAWYMILSQISVWGIHMSIVKFVPEKTKDEDKSSFLITGLAIAFFTACIVTLLAEIVLLLFNDFPWRYTMQIAFVGMILLSVDKVLLNYLNAIYRMKAYAFFSSLRYVCFGTIILIESIMGVKSDFLAAVFPLTETIVFLAMGLYFVKKIDLAGRIKKDLVGKLLYFGTKIIPSYIVLELNTKVDIICLGALMTDVSQIGVYSFAVYFTEGFYMLYAMIRKIINPDIAKANFKGELEENLNITIQGLRKYIYFGGIAAYLAISMGYMIICFVVNRFEYACGVVYILLIGLSIFINGKSIIFGDLLAQIGFPLEESILNIITVSINFILNIILIFSFGIIGAALSTAISYFVFNLYMRWRVYKIKMIKI